MSEAKKYNIRLILSLVNNWSDYGGKPQYVKWGKDAGLNLSSEDDFFSDATLKTYYKNHIKVSSLEILYDPLLSWTELLVLDTGMCLLIPS